MGAVYTSFCVQIWETRHLRDFEENRAWNRFCLTLPGWILWNYRYREEKLCFLPFKWEMSVNSKISCNNRFPCAMISVMMVGTMKKTRDTDELATLKISKRADTEALEALFDGYYDRIYAYCVHRLFCRTVAEDVTGAIFLAAAAGIEAVTNDGPDAHVRWLYAMATNHCNAYIRKHLRRRKLFEKLQQQYPSPDSTAAAEPDWTVVYGAIAQLKPIEQTIITLRFFEEMDYDRIAAIINKRQTSVRVILHRALKKLQKLLNAAECGFEN